MLSKKQKQFVENNLNLRFTIIRKYNFSIAYDSLQEAALAICKSVIIYKGLSKFSSFAAKSIKWELIKYGIKESKYKKIKNKLNTFHYSESYEEKWPKLDCDIKNILKSLDKRSKKIIILYYIKGKTFREIAPLFNVSYQRIQQIIIAATEKLKEDLYDY